MSSRAYGHSVRQLNLAAVVALQPEIERVHELAARFGLEDGSLARYFKYDDGGNEDLELSLEEVHRILNADHEERLVLLNDVRIGQHPMLEWVLQGHSDPELEELLVGKDAEDIDEEVVRKLLSDRFDGIVTEMSKKLGVRVYGYARDLDNDTEVYWAVDESSLFQPTEEYKALIERFGKSVAMQDSWVEYN